jgi:hypothetical protein
MNDASTLSVSCWHPASPPAALPGVHLTIGRTRFARNGHAAMILVRLRVLVRAVSSCRALLVRSVVRRGFWRSPKKLPRRRPPENGGLVKCLLRVARERSQPGQPWRASRFARNDAPSKHGLLMACGWHTRRCERVNRGGAANGPEQGPTARVEGHVRLASAEDGRS